MLFLLVQFLIEVLFIDLTAVEEIEINTFSFDKASNLSMISIIKWIC